MSNPGNIVGGYKANLNNANTSEESEQHSREVLDNEFNGGDAGQGSSGEKTPNVSQEAKDSAEARLEDM
ncbi:hypothetical protein MMC24_002945 [Lignoscripta atroalba]|nr:hypothetical protein [Lignoscripta atroalba]